MGISPNTNKLITKSRLKKKKKNRRPFRESLKFISGARFSKAAKRYFLKIEPIILQSCYFNMSLRRAMVNLRQRLVPRNCSVLWVERITLSQDTRPQLFKSWIALSTG